MIGVLNRYIRFTFVTNKYICISVMCDARLEQLQLHQGLWSHVFREILLHSATVCLFAFVLMQDSTISTCNISVTPRWNCYAFWINLYFSVTVTVAWYYVLFLLFFINFLLPLCSASVRYRLSWLHVRNSSFKHTLNCKAVCCYILSSHTLSDVDVGTGH